MTTPSQPVELMPDLKSCPFCQCEVHRRQLNQVQHPANRCVLMALIFDVEEWNTRSSPAQSDEWMPIETAPRDVRCLVYGQGGVRTGYKDDIGNWRAFHHGPLKVQPTHWQHLPQPPKQKDKL